MKNKSKLLVGLALTISFIGCKSRESTSSKGKAVAARTYSHNVALLAMDAGDYINTVGESMQTNIVKMDHLFTETLKNQGFTPINVSQGKMTLPLSTYREALRRTVENLEEDATLFLYVSASASTQGLVFGGETYQYESLFQDIQRFRKGKPAFARLWIVLDAAFSGEIARVNGAKASFNPPEAKLTNDLASAIAQATGAGYKKDHSTSGFSEFVILPGAAQSEMTSYAPDGGLFTSALCNAFEKLATNYSANVTNLMAEIYGASVTQEQNGASPALAVAPVAPTNYLLDSKTAGRILGYVSDTNMWTESLWQGVAAPALTDF